MNDTVRAVVVDPEVQGRLAVREVEADEPGRDEAMVRVASISLNRGEIRYARSAVAGWRPGWDLAGTVEQSAADGSGPHVGERVVGVLRSGAWAERVAVPTNQLAVLPDAVSFAQAAALPVAGLTALYALEEGGALLGRRVLVTGASGGVGDLAVQLARDMGATVTALVHQERFLDTVRAAGAHHALAGEGAAIARGHGPFWLILDSVGGQTLGDAMRMLERGGICVTLGISGGPNATFDVDRFFNTGGARLYGFAVFHEFAARPASAGLARLAALVADGRLRPTIALELSWRDVGDVAQQLWDRRYPGKAILHLDR